jgi:hypothetical protein
MELNKYILFAELVDYNDGNVVMYKSSSTNKYMSLSQLIFPKFNEQKNTGLQIRLVLCCFDLETLNACFG